MTEMLEKVRNIVSAHFPERKIKSIEDRGEWVRHIFAVTLDGDERIFVKVSVHPEWLESARVEKQVEDLLTTHGLPAPHVLVADDSGEIIAQPYVIQEQVGGVRLGDLLEREPEEEITTIYETLGTFYRRLHNIQGPASGIWIESPDKPVGSPTDYMYQAEILEGSGQRALQAGCISQETYDRAVHLWAKHLDFLRNHPPSLLHASPFLWTIYFEKDTGVWQVSKIGSMGDALWWDPAYDLAFLQYPPFGKFVPFRWEAFVRGYGPLPERKRILLYLIMQRLCAAMGVYLEPQKPAYREWAQSCLKDLDLIMKEIASIG